MNRLIKLVAIGVFLGILCFGDVSYAAEANQEIPDVEAQIPQEQGELPGAGEVMPQEQIPEVLPAPILPEQPIVNNTAAQPASPEAEGSEEMVPEEGGVDQEFEMIGRMMTANDEANVRTGPDTIYRSLGRLSVGQEVFVFGRLSDEWYQIQFEENIAYVSGDYLMAQETGDVPVETEQGDTAANTALIKELNEQIDQLSAERDAAQEEARKAMDAAASSDKLTQKHIEEKNNKVNSMALLMAGLFAAVFIGGIIILLVAERKNKVNKKAENSGDEDDGLEVISLTDKVDHIIKEEYNEDKINKNNIEPMDVGTDGSTDVGNHILRKSNGTPFP